MAGQFTIKPGTQIVDPRTGLLTTDGARFLLALQQAVFEGEVVTIGGEQTLTGKTIDGDLNTIRDIAASSLKSTTGNGGTVVTGEFAGEGVIPAFDANGNLTSTGATIADLQAHSDTLDALSNKDAPAGDLVGTTDVQDLSDKTFLTPPILPTFTVAGVPSAATYARGLIYVSNGTSNKRLAISDGTNWRFPDGNIVS